MNKPINIQTFVCEISKCPDIQRLEAENEKLLKELQYKYEEMDAKDFLLMGEDLNFWKNLKAENEKLKKEVSDLKFYINSYKIIWEIDKKEQYKQALEEVREIINFRFKTPYMKLGLKETDKIIEDIEKIINEVLKDEI